VDKKSSGLVQEFDWEIEEGLAEVQSEPVVVPFEIGSKSKIPHLEIPPAQSQVICIASGKGGTGKTTFTTNLAIALQTRGLRVLIVDADFGLANDHLLLGLTPQGDVSDVLAGRKDVREVLLEGPAGVHLLPGGVGASELSTLEDYELRSLAREIGRLEPDYDIILVDLAAGVSPQIMRLLKPAHEIILVTNPEVTALLDAYGLVKCLSVWNHNQPLKFQVVMNRVRDREESIAAMQRMRRVVAKHLRSVDFNYLGYVPFDRYLLHSISLQEPVVLSHPRAFVTTCLKAIEQRVHTFYRSWDRNQHFKSPFPSYFAKLEQQTYE
jgi:flagellar biosynthesis protein FlhG